jgi:CofD-related protein of GAK system
MVQIPLTRVATVPDPIRLARYLRVPELGPRVLFFSGGTALRATSQALIGYTHNSIHLITPFDSGGSSAKLRASFPMIAVGDLRNRLMALADTKLRGHPTVYELFSTRLPKDEDDAALRDRLRAMIRGEDALVAAIPSPLRKLIRAHLGYFEEQMPEDFDLRGASIGNLILAGGYLFNERDVDAVLFLFSRLVEVRGIVRPVVDANLHLVAELDDGSRLVGQHRVTRRDARSSAPTPARIVDLHLSSDLDDDVPTHADIDQRTRELVDRAELIVFPIGSFWTSVVANLLPRGVGASVAAAACPKVYVPNCGDDPEQAGMTTADTVVALLRKLREDAGPEVPTHRLLDVVLVDSVRGAYPGGLDVAAIQALGVQVLDVELITAASAPMHDPGRLVDALLSLV